MEHWQEVTILLTLGTVLANILITWFNKNKGQDEEILILKREILQATKDIKELNKHINRIYGDIRMLRENDLKHIEISMASINVEIATIKTVLKERLPYKSNGLK